MSIVLLIVPDFTLILLGFLLYRYAGFGQAFWPGLEALVYYVLFPALLFRATSGAQFGSAGTGAFLATGLAVTLSGVALASSLRFAFREDALTYASGAQTAFRFNSYMALALAARLSQDGGLALMALLVGTNVLVANLAAVILMAREGRAGVARALARNPLILATALGLASNLAGLHPPEPVAIVLERLGNASLALGLMTVGAGLRLTRTPVSRVLIGWWLAVKLIALPGCAWLMAAALALSPAQRQIAVLFGALPSASSAYILAVRMGGNGPLVAFLISASTVLSAVTLPLWLAAVAGT